MGLFSGLKKKELKEREIDLSPQALGTRYNYTLDEVKGILTGTVCDRNLLALYKTIPEVAFPVNLIAKKVASGNFMLKKISDDSVVFDNKEINKFLSKPNPLQSFNELLMTHIAYKKITGNSFFRAAVSNDIKSNELWKWCDNYWVLPSDHVKIETPINIPLFSSASLSDIVKYYKLSFGTTFEQIDPRFIMHSKELCFDYINPLRGVSLLASQYKPISNLIAVYEARNVIYTKRGALGFIVSKKQDETGTIPFTPDEKVEINKEYQRMYGVGRDKSPVGILNDNSDFIRMNLSIAELEPFKETLNDACAIAGALSVSSGLLPREDMGTFNNQSTEEKKLYTNVAIPEAKAFCVEISALMGLEQSGLYIDVDFSHIDCLKEGYKEEQQTKSIISKRCKDDFMGGVITLNDWRAQIGESRVANPLYDKLILEMNDKEMELIFKIYGSKSNTAKNANNANLQN